MASDRKKERKKEKKGREGKKERKEERNKKGRKRFIFGEEKIRFLAILDKLCGAGDASAWGTRSRG